jgi:LytS/YehU family sensor histidine kinase
MASVNGILGFIAVCAIIGFKQKSGKFMSFANIVLLLFILALFAGSVASYVLYFKKEQEKADFIAVLVPFIAGAITLLLVLLYSPDSKKVMALEQSSVSADTVPDTAMPI